MNMIRIFLRRVWKTLGMSPVCKVHFIYVCPLSRVHAHVLYLSSYFQRVHAHLKLYVDFKYAPSLGCALV